MTNNKIKNFVITNWKSFGYGEYKDYFYEILIMNQILNDIYKTTQFKTFNNKNKKVKLYRGISTKEKEFKQTKRTKKITTGKLTSFSENKETARDFSFPDVVYPFGILFEITIDTKDILMTYKDWLKESSINKDTSEFEYVLINKNQKTYNINILEMYEYGEHGSKRISF